MLEAWLVLTSVKYHRNLYILTPLNQRLAPTRLRATGPRSITERSDTTHWFDAVDLLIFLYLTIITRQLEILEKIFFLFPFFSILVKIRPEKMFNDVLSIKEAFLEYKDVSFSKSRKSDFIKGANRCF